MMCERSSIYLPEAITSLLSIEECSHLEQALKGQTRASMLTEKYFIKASFSDDAKKLRSLRNEVKVYTTFCPLKIRYPKLQCYYANSHLVILVSERIDALALAERRDTFNIHSGARVEAVLHEIAKLGAEKIPSSWHYRYNRDKKVDKYIKDVYQYMPEITRSALDSLIGSLHVDTNLAFSHGDILPMNILVNKEKYWFVDWEWADIRPRSFDPAFFLLFSYHPLAGMALFEKLHQTWNPAELYRDAVVISLHEMKLWITQVSPGPKQVARITMWLRVLEEAVRWLRLH